MRVLLAHVFFLLFTRQHGKLFYFNTTFFVPSISERL